MTELHASIRNLPMIRAAACMFALLAAPAFAAPPPDFGQLDAHQPPVQLLDTCQPPVLMLVTAVGTPLDWSPKDLSGTAAKLAQYSYDGAIDLKEWTLRMSGMPECRKMELLLRYDEPDVDSGYFVTQCVEIAP